MSKIYSGLFLGLLTLLGMYSYAQVSVTATAGTTGPTTYTTVKAAFDAINAGTHQGAITVSITANTTETASAVLNGSGSGAASYTGVTLKPAAGVSAAINGNVDGPVIAIMGSNVTVDGSNNATTSRNLTINNLDTSKINVIGVFSDATVSNVTIKNSIVKGGLVGILVSDADSLGGPGNFSNINIQNDSIASTYYGIFTIAKPITGNGQLNISNNRLTASGSAANISMGIYVQGFDGVTVSGNHVANFEASEEDDDEGIWLATGTKNALVEKNKIYNLTHTGGAGYAGHGIRVSSGVTGANIAIANNMIWGITGDGWDYASQFVLDNPIGILLHSTQSGIAVVYNTIHLSGNTLNQTGAMSMGMFVGTGTTQVVVQDNIIVNNLGLSGTTGYGAVGIYAVTGASQFASINYNDYYVAPTGSGNKFIGQLAAAGSTTLAAWQAAVSGDANSLNVLPTFVSATDLHLVAASNAALSNKGTPVTGVTTDIDGETRNASTPDMGADEFAGPTSVFAIDGDVSVVRLLPNMVTSQAVLNVQAKKSMKINWYVMDASGRTVMSFNKDVMAGQNNISVSFDNIPAGVYHILGVTEKGKTEVVKFVKQ